MRPAPAIFATTLIAPYLVLVSACMTPVPATVTLSPSVPLKTNPVVFLLARAQRERIAESLRKAGISPTDRASDSDYALEVRMGRSRSTQECGELHNVAYILTENGARLMVIKGRGWTGACEPNTFDDMSRTLASYVSN